MACILLPSILMGFINEGKDFHINPFSLEDSPSNRAFLLHFYAQMAKVDSYDKHNDKIEDRTAATTNLKIL